jgi:hypothetical protein
LYVTGPKPRSLGIPETLAEAMLDRSRILS